MLGVPDEPRGAGQLPGVRAAAAAGAGRGHLALPRHRPRHRLLRAVPHRDTRVGSANIARILTNQMIRCVTYQCLFALLTCTFNSCIVFTLIQYSSNPNI